MTFESTASFRSTRVSHCEFQDCTFGPSLELGISTDHGGEHADAVELHRVRWSTPSILAISGGQVAVRRSVIGEPITISRNVQSPRDFHSDFEPLGWRIRRDDPASWGDTPLTEFVRNTVLKPVILTGIPLTRTEFDGSTGLDQLRFVGDPHWPRRWRWFRRQVADETEPRLRAKFLRQRDTRIKLRDAVDYATVEAVYRQLRVGLEASKAAPAAADFYVGELEARRRRARWWSPEHWLLFGYRWIGGYGVRFLPPLLWLVTVIAGTAAWFYNDEDLLAAPDPPLDTTADPDPAIDVDTRPSFESYNAALAFVLRSSVSVFSAPVEGLSPAGTFVLIGERFTAVSLAAMAIFALRSKVQR